MTFGHISLPTFQKGTNLSFEPFPGSHIDESQQCLLDNFWNAKNESRKILTALNFIIKKSN